MIIMKFGGTSVENAIAINRLYEISKTKIKRKPVIVVSAISKATDTLTACSKLAENQKLNQSLELLDNLIFRHIQICEDLSAGNKKFYNNTVNEIKKIREEISEILKGISLLCELSSRSMAKVISYGEILSSIIIYNYFLLYNEKISIIDARKIIYTDNNYLKAEPNIKKIRNVAPKIIRRNFKNNNFIITQGFIGTAENGSTSTLGRGGSDYSASLLGMAVNAEEIDIWTDVDGILTADPRCTKKTKKVEKISFEEAAELAYFGAKVLHPLTIQPAVEKNIPVRILNSKNPKNSGTLILSGKNLLQESIRSIACKDNIKVMNIFSTKMLNSYGFLKKIFEIFDKHKTSVDLITTSEVNVSITLDNEEHIPEITKELSEFAKVNIEKDKSLICIVGSNLKNKKGIAKKIFQVTGDFKITMISQGASAINLSFVVDTADSKKIIQLLHNNIFK